MVGVQNKNAIPKIAFDVKNEESGSEEAEGPPNDIVSCHPADDRVAGVQAVFVGSIDVVGTLWNDTGWPGLKRLAGSRDCLGYSGRVAPHSPERTRIVRGKD